MPHRLRDSSICAGPRAPEGIQTLSAEKTCFGRPSLPRPYPITSCEEPYMGDVSISRPPSRKNARITSAHELRAATSSPTLNVIELPSPTSGSRSPVDGTARVTIGPRWPEAVRGPRTEAAPAAPIEARRVRRSMGAIANLAGTKRGRGSSSFRGLRARKREEPEGSSRILRNGAKRYLQLAPAAEQLDPPPARNGDTWLK